MKRARQPTHDLRLASPDQTFAMRPTNFALKADAFAGYEIGDGLSAYLDGNSSNNASAPVRFANYPEHSNTVQIRKIRWQNKFYDDSGAHTYDGLFSNYQITLTVDQDATALLTGGRSWRKVRFRNFDADTEMTLYRKDAIIIAKPGRDTLPGTSTVSWYWETDHTVSNNIFTPIGSDVNVEWFYEEEYK